MTSEKKQVQVNEVKELDKSSAKKKQPAEKTLLKEDFMEA